MISFLVLGIALYGLAHLWQLASSEPIIKHTKKCKYCRQRINEKVRRSNLKMGLRLTLSSLFAASSVPVGLMDERTATELTLNISYAYVIPFAFCLFASPCCSQIAHFFSEMLCIMLALIMAVIGRLSLIVTIWKCCCFSPNTKRLILRSS